MSWLDIPRTLATLVTQQGNIIRQNQHVATQAARHHRETRELVMAVGNKVLAALSQIDEAISSEADDLASLIASTDSIDDETSKLLLERVARIKAIVPEKAPAVGEAADDGTAQPPAENPVADAQTPPSVGDATDAPGNADAPGDGVNGETGNGTPA